MLTNPDRVLDELEIVATVEHALIVGYLSVCCALGANSISSSPCTSCTCCPDAMCTR
jgi:hypothetical protein